MLNHVRDLILPPLMFLPASNVVKSVVARAERPKLDHAAGDISGIRTSAIESLST